MSAVASPLIFNRDFGYLANELAKISNADFAHVGIMDNHFVPNLALGLPLAKTAVKSSPIPVDAHLMIEDPDRWASVYAELGCGPVIFHVEAAWVPIRLAHEIRAMGRRAGLVLRPATGIEPYLDVFGEFDMILVMTMEPSFGDQPFIEAMTPKVSCTCQAAEAAGPDVWVQVDDGVSHSMIERAAEAGANDFIAGSTVYKADDAVAEVGFLRFLTPKYCC